MTRKGGQRVFKIKDEIAPPVDRSMARLEISNPTKATEKSVPENSTVEEKKTKAMTGNDDDEVVETVEPSMKPEREISASTTNSTSKPSKTTRNLKMERIQLPLGVPAGLQGVIDRIAEKAKATPAYVVSACVARTLAAMKTREDLDLNICGSSRETLLIDSRRQIYVRSDLIDDVQALHDPLGARPRREHALAAFQAYMEIKIKELAAQQGVDELH